MDSEVVCQNLVSCLYRTYFWASLARAPFRTSSERAYDTQKRCLVRQLTRVLTQLVYCLEWTTKIQFHYRPEQLLIANDQCASPQQDPHLGVQYNACKLLSSSSVTFPHRDESHQRLNWRTYRYRHLELLLSIHYKADADFNGPLTVFQQKTSICVVRLLSESFYSMLSVVRVQSAPRWGEKFDVNVSDVSPLHLAQAALRSFSPPLQRAAVGLLIKWLCLN